MTSYEILREVVDYDPYTGYFTWKDGFQKGLRADYHDHGGYRVVSSYRHKSERLYAHRLAFFFMTGAEPPNFIDHEDTDKSNNAWRNLRPATKAQNEINKGKTKRNTSGWKGVGWHKQSSKWRANINSAGKFHHLGLFDCPAAASLAYQIAAYKHFGEYARIG